MKEEIEYYWKQVKYFFSRHWQGIKNLFIYAPLIYNTREYDYCYTLDLLEFKLNRLGDYIEKHNRFVGCRFVVRDIRLCNKLLKKYKEEDYSVEYLGYYSSTINFEPYEDTDLSVMVESDIVHNFGDYFAKYPLIYKKVLKEGITDEKHIAMRISDINQNRCKKLFFKLLEECVEHWWD